jgi:phenylacetate-CoA ligase
VNRRLVGLYHRLPTPARNAAAAMRGLYLRAWRYGPETDRMADEAIEREQWSAAQWAAWRSERLATVLERAATRVPYYRDQWAARRRAGDRASWEVLENWPILEKEMVRQLGIGLLADDCDRRRMFHEHTSGTTGTSLDLWWSRVTVRAWYALFEARWRRWYGVTRHDRWAIIGGQLVTPVARRTPPFWVWNPALRQLYLSAYHLAPDLVPFYLDAMRRYRIRHLFGYSSALHALALGAGAGGATNLQLAVVTTNAEPLFPHQREAITAAFGCPVRETYGMAEIVTAASECAAGRLHEWPEVGIVECVATDAMLGDDESVGDLVCTGLLNDDMPLVRYRVGDRGAWDSDSSPCGCGRTLPRIARLEGRADDTLFTRDGRAVGRMDPVFKSRAPEREAQIVQEALDPVRVRVVPADGYTSADGVAIAARIRDRLGDVVVTVDEVTEIPRTANGKLRAVICQLPESERARLRANAARP